MANNCGTFCKVCFKPLLFTWKEIEDDFTKEQMWRQQLCSKHLGEGGARGMTKITLQRYSPYWDNLRGPTFVESTPQFYASGEQVTDAEIYGLAFAIQELCHTIFTRSTDLARDLASGLDQSRQFKLTGTIELRHDVYLEDHHMAVKLEIEIEEGESNATG